MAIRITGLNSGLDTESIISALVSAKSVKIESVKKQQTLLSWKQDAWKSLNTKILNLYDNFISSMRFSSSYSKKTTTTSNDSAVKVVTGSGAVNGVQTLQVSQLAKTAYLTGGQVTSSTGEALTTSSKISDLAGAEDCNGTISLKMGDTTTDITITNETTISDVLSQLQDAGLNATFDTKNNRFFVSAKESGADNDFSITASDASGMDILSAMGLDLYDDATMAEYTELASAYDSTSYENTIANLSTQISTAVADKVASYVSAYSSALETIESASETIEEITEKYTDADTGDFTLKSVDEYNELIEDIQAQIEDWETTYEQAQKDVEASPGNTEFVAAREEASAKLEELNAQLEQYQTELADAESLADAQESLEEANATLEEVATYVTITTDKDGTVTGEAKDALTEEVSQSYYNKAAYASEVVEAYNNGELTSSATKIAGQDSIIYLNGAEFTDSTNTFEINGLTYTVMQETGDSEITITTQDDTDGIYDMIKDFLTEYNALIIEMDTLYNAESASDYSPLTSEEKEAMTESEIEDWETKIKDALLRRDTTLNSVSSALKSVMSSGIEVNGTTMYLSSFGISTLGYFTASDNERYAYHIDGDADDSQTSGNSDVLKTMIANDPDSVTTFFTELSKNLYSTLSTLMKSTSYSSAYTVYNDKQMETEYSDYTTKIAELEEKLEDYEDRYYEKFAAMETALANLSSKQSAISSLLSS